MNFLINQILNNRWKMKIQKNFHSLSRIFFKKKGMIHQYKFFKSSSLINTDLLLKSKILIFLQIFEFFKKFF